MNNGEVSERISLRIDVKKIDKRFLFAGKKGLYASFVLWLNRDGQDQFGNDYSVQQDIPKDARDAGEKGPYVGSAKILGNGGKQQQRPAQGYQQRQQSTAGGRDEDDDIPF